MRLYPLRFYIKGGRMGVPPILRVSGGSVSTFNRNGTSYTQITGTESLYIDAEGGIIGSQWALIGGGGSGGNSTAGHTWPGGGGASNPVIGGGVLAAGQHNITIGAGGAGVVSHGNGNAGSDSVWDIDGVTFAVSTGGGYGGNGPGGDGGNGGGAGGSSPGEVYLGGSGTHRGGNSYPNVANGSRRGGGGGGAGGDGEDADSGVSGAGGAGAALDFIGSVVTVCDGGGSVSGDDTGNYGSGSFGRRLHAGGSAAGGDGLFALVFPSENARVASS